jgi:hypothetical protein
MVETVRTSKASLYFNETTWHYIPEIVIGGLDVSVLAIGSKVSGFKHGRG